MDSLILLAIGANIYSLAGLLTLRKYEINHKKYLHNKIGYDNNKATMKAYPDLLTFVNLESDTSRYYAKICKYIHAQDPVTKDKAAYIVMSWPVVLWSWYK